MTEPQQPDAAANSGKTIPTEQALEIRRLAHDLSNALEMIIQTSYLVGTLDLDPHGREWMRMLDAAVARAIDVNGELRSYIQANSRGASG